MIDKLIKVSSVFLFACTVILLYRISTTQYIKYQLASSNGEVRIIDVKTGFLYFYDRDYGMYYFIQRNGEPKYIKRLP